MSRFHRTSLIVLATLLALPLFISTPAFAGTERYASITSLPYTISNPGGYKLVGNLAYPSLNGVAITITCDNVVLDLDGFTIFNQTPQDTSAPTPAIQALGRSNITIRNGKIRSFNEGIRLSGDGSAGGLVVEDMTVMSAKSVAIVVETSQGPIVRRCNIANTGGASYMNIAAIRMTGKYALVTDNAIIKIDAYASGTGIDTSGSDYAVIARNEIRNVNPAFFAGMVGINATGANSVVIGNRIAQWGTGVTMASTTVYRDNIVDPAGTKYVGGTSGGNNF